MHAKWLHFVHHIAILMLEALTKNPTSIHCNGITPMNTMNIYRAFVVLLAAVLMSAPSIYAQDSGNEDRPGGAAGSIEVVDEFDWGTIAPADLKADIEIKNSGDGVLVIDQVKPSCGCTTAPLDKNTLKPGESTMMHVTLKASNRTGGLTKSVAIMSNDPNNPTKVVRLRANIQRDITFNPDAQYLLFNNAVVGNEAEASIFVQNTSQEPITLHAPKVTEGDASMFRFNLTDDMVLKPGEKFEFKAFATPTSKENIDGRAVLTTSSEMMPEREFRLYGKVMDQAEVAPAAKDAMISHQNAE